MKSTMKNQSTPFSRSAAGIRLQDQEKEKPAAELLRAGSL